MFGVHAECVGARADDGPGDCTGAGDPARSQRTVRAAREIDRRLPPGRVALITGPSGGGKSCLLRALERVIRERGGVVVRAQVGLSGAESASPIVDLFGPCSQTALRWLSRVGLAEPALFPLCAGELSEGQRFRLAVARAMWRVETWHDGDHVARVGQELGTVLIDEFASSLEATSAITLGAALRRCAARTGVRLVCAGVRDDPTEALGVDLLTLCPLAGEVRIFGRVEETESAASARGVAA